MSKYKYNYLAVTDLVERFQRGPSDQKDFTFSQICRRFKGAIEHRAWQYAQANDVENDVDLLIACGFRTLSYAVKNFNPEHERRANFAAYFRFILLRNLNNTAEALASRGKRYEQTLQDYREISSLGRSGRLGNFSGNGNSLAGKLSDEFECLPKRDRQILHLVDIEGLTFRQAAKYLGINYETIRLARKEIIRRLRARLETAC